MHWPEGIKAKGELRSQFHHVIDVAPTILEAAGLPEPISVNGVQQKPIEGVSMVYSFRDAKAADRHETQYFEMFGNRGIYHKGWTAVTRLIEATRYNVLPLDDRVAERLNPDTAGRPVLIKGNSQILFGGMGRLSENSVVSVKNKSHSVTALIEVPKTGAEGVVITQGVTSADGASMQRAAN